MKSKLLVFFCILFVGCKSTSQNKQQAYFESESRLNIIKSFVDDNNTDSTLTRAEAVAFLKKLTKIESESPFIAESKLNPTRNDYEKWWKWNEENKSKVFCDERSKRILLTSD